MIELDFIKEIPIGIYGIFLFLYLFSQILYSILEKNKQNKVKDIILENFPFVSILVPFYNEEEKELDEAIQSLLDLDYPKDKYEILLMDDGSDNNVSEYIVNKYKNEIKIFYQKNKGKREAQYALTKVRDDRAIFYLTVDSDSVLNKNCLKEIVKTAVLFQCEAVTGGILAKKQNNFLNRLLRIRYWTANWQERLSQSYFNQIGCCSGPCSLWNAEIFDKVSDEYISQMFLGKKCTYGDDRHMTNLFLRENCKMKMSNIAYCYTTTPETWKKWMKQQFRWSKSFYRESIWITLNLKGKICWFFIYQNTISFLLPFILLSNLFIYLIFYSPTKFAIFLYLLSVFLSGLIRGLYSFFCTKDPTYFLAPIYGFVHFIIVFPIKIMALFKLKDTSWGTR